MGLRVSRASRFTAFWVVLLLAVSAWAQPRPATGVHVAAPLNPNTPVSGLNCSDATTRCVPSEYATIDACADAANAGDTCLVAAATYLENVTPSHNGTSGNTITFVANGTVTLCQITFVNGNQYQRWIGFTIDYSFTGCSGVRTVRDAAILFVGTNTGMEFWNNTISHSTYGFGQPGLADRLTNSLFIGNICLNINVPDQGRGGGSCLVHYGTHNLIAYNNVGPTDADAFNFSGTHIQFLNNYLHDAKELSGHADFFQTDSHDLGQSQILYEGNFQKGQGNMNDEHTGVWQNQTAGQCQTTCGAPTQQIWRRNVWHNLSGGSLGIAYAPLGDLTFNFIYNNTTPLADLNQSSSPHTINLDPNTNNNYVYNEIFYQAWSVGLTSGITYAATGSSTTSADYNLAFHPSATLSFAAAWTNQAHEQSNVNPNFTSVGSRQFWITGGSDGANARGTGGPLTTAVSCSGTTLTVASNTGGFFRGDDTTISQYAGGLVKGDTITIGASTTREISTISGNTITLTTSATCSNGDAVAFGDDATPEIGAYPYKSGGYALSATYASGGGTTTVTPNDASLVRFVVFYSDGVPYAVDNASPYTAATPSGTFSARVYPLYPSETLWAVATP